MGWTRLRSYLSETVGIFKRSIDRVPRTFVLTALDQIKVMMMVPSRECFAVQKASEDVISFPTG